MQSEMINLTAHDGIYLKGQFTIPSRVHACALILPGFGNTGLSGDISSPFIGTGYQGKPTPLSEQLAFTLANEPNLKIASLRYEKRGFADPMHFSTQTLPNLVLDAQTALQSLQSKFPGLPVFLCGFSEGALIATELASRQDIAGLFLLSPPTRPYPEALRYQFIHWPLSVLKSLDPNCQARISRTSLYAADIRFLPTGDMDEVIQKQIGLTLPSIECASLPFDEDDQISFARLEEIYEARLSQIYSIILSPMMKGIYDAYLEFTPFKTLAAQVKAPTFVYVGFQDAQIDAEWIIKDVQSFNRLEVTHVFQNLGHCFAPMQGTMGQLKTSGPIAMNVLQSISNDVTQLLI